MRFKRHGDEAAFAELVRKHGPMVMAVCRQSLRQQQDAEDAFQAVWIVLLRRGRAIRNGASLAGWLYRVAHRTALRAARRRHRRREVTMHDEHTDTRDSLEAVRRHSLVRSLLDEVEQLPERFREPMVLVYLEGKSYAQAAAELECTAATVRGRLTRGKRLLRTRLLSQGVSLASAMAVAGVALAPETALAEMTHLVELASAAATATTGTGAVSSGGTGTEGAATQITIPDTTISLAEEGIRTMLLTSMTTKLAATALVLCASVGVWTLQADGQGVADSDTSDGGVILLAQADADADEEAAVDVIPSKVLPPDDENIYEIVLKDSASDEESPTADVDIKDESSVSDNVPRRRRRSGIGDPTSTTYGVSGRNYQGPEDETDAAGAAGGRGGKRGGGGGGGSDGGGRPSAFWYGGAVPPDQVPQIQTTPRAVSALAPVTPPQVGMNAQDPGLAAEELRLQGEYLDMKANAMKIRYEARENEVTALEQSDDEKREFFMHRSLTLDARAKAMDTQAEWRYLEGRAQMAQQQAPKTGGTGRRAAVSRDVAARDSHLWHHPDQPSTNQSTGRVRIGSRGDHETPNDRRSGGC